jgi:hypothetical protein
VPKTLTLQVSDQQVAEVELIARIQDRSMSALIRLALDRHTDVCRNDPDFQRRLNAACRAQQRAAERLGVTPGRSGRE